MFLAFGKEILISSLPTPLDNNMKIAVYAICKNEENNVRAFLENVSDADLVVVTDTGSTDGTMEILQDSNIIPHLDIYSAGFEPFRFDVARNFCLNQIPQTIDFCIFLDLDERLEDGWYDKLQEILLDKVPDEVYMDMIHSTDSEGNTKTTYYQLKAHARNGYVWRYPCHEVLITDKAEPISVSSDISITHIRNTGSADYLGLLELGAKERPNDQRVLFYLGREYFSQELYLEAIKTLTLALDAKYMQWSKQKAACYKFIAKSVYETNGFAKSQPYFYQYLSLSLDEAEAHYTLAELYFSEGHYLMAIGFCHEIKKLAEKTEKTDNFIYRDLDCWTWKPYDILAYSYYHLGNYQEYLNNAVRALELSPEYNQRLHDNVLDAYAHVNLQGENPNEKTSI